MGKLVGNVSVIVTTFGAALGTEPRASVDSVVKTASTADGATIFFASAAGVAVVRTSLP